MGSPKNPNILIQQNESMNEDGSPLPQIPESSEARTKTAQSILQKGLGQQSNTKHGYQTQPSIESPQNTKKMS